jgi:hypothetical protein
MKILTRQTILFYLVILCTPLSDVKSQTIADKKTATASISVVMAFFFMTSSYLIHRYWLCRPKSLLILWQVIGFAGFCGFVFMTLVFRPSNLYCLPDLWMRWLVGIILVALVNLVYGLVIELAARHYLQEESPTIS